ncbi:alpha-2,8-sialyltransferase 8F isoform X2 [Scleropages formosus]|uniref:alpha-2,8-sialyltransferase 8F isoform X2 n=1 Tax=Scleropages formosus TaxID=113540 RepID=UPI000878C437|nr:alpha-2,8-sialyltransferase 8F-like isoform X2 [Scleropages formosus]
MRRCYLLMFCLLVLTTVMLIVYLVGFSKVKARGPAQEGPKRPEPEESEMCQECREKTIKKLMTLYSPTWKKQEANLHQFRSQLQSKCNGISSAVITQENTPVGSKVIYDGEKRKPLQVTPKLFSTFVKEAPFRNHTSETCAVVGNSGILSNSSCGDEINSAQFVIRFNGLTEQRRPFAESLVRYGDSLLLLPAFSYWHNTAVSLRAVYTLQDFDGSARPIFLNPEYLRGLTWFWRARGLKAMRLSTGLIVASLASELCANVHLYGFWPFPWHPHGGGPLTNHYYDNRQSKKKVHNMPDEFVHLLRLHNQGVVKLHLGKCEP